MTEPETGEGRDASRKEDETSPFPLERKSEAPPPPDAAAARSMSETTGEHTGPFMLERERAIEQEDAEPPSPAPIVPLSKGARRARRKIAITLGVHTLLLASLAALSIVRWTKGVATPPELAFAVLTGGIALVHLRAGARFARLGRQPARDAHLLSGALHDLRTVIVMKAIALFLALTLLCFSLSMLISLVVSF